MPVQPIPPDQIPAGKEVATLGGGCFWCLEAVFDDLAGVESVESGYMGGRNREPTYEEVCGGDTGHAEVVRVTFDPKAISYRDILQVFFVIHDPTTLNRQGNDVGTQYRSAIFHHSPEQKKVADEVIAELAREKVYDDRIVTEVSAGGRLLDGASDTTRTTSATIPASPTACGSWRRRSQKFRKHFLAKVKKARALNGRAAPRRRIRAPGKRLHHPGRGEAHMFGRLMPFEGRFFELFNELAGEIVKGSRELAAMMASFDDLERRAFAIETIEKRGDRITHDTIELLHKTFITPLDRDDIHQLVTRMDDILDLIEDVAQSVNLYDIRTITAETRRLCDLCVACAEQVQAGVARALRPEGAAGDARGLRRDRPARVGGRPRDARGDGEALPRRAGREADHQAALDLRAARVDHRPLRGRGEHHREHHPRERLSGALRHTR